MRPSLTAMSIAAPFEWSTDAGRHPALDLGLGDAVLQKLSTRTGQLSPTPYGVREPHGSAIRASAAAFWTSRVVAEMEYPVPPPPTPQAPGDECPLGL